MIPNMSFDKKYFAGFCALLLSACGSTTEPPAPAVSTPPPVAEVPATTAEPEVAEVFKPDLEQIREATPAEVQTYVGAPTLVRRDDTVQVMTFETERCVFQVIFYEPSPGASFRARHISARDRTGQDTAIEPCLSGVMGHP